MTHLLDTDICIGVLRQRQNFVHRLQQLSPQQCAVSTITVYELLCGVRKARDPQAERMKVERFLSVLSILSFDHSAAGHAAEIRADLEARGTPIGPYDLLLAGHAIATNLILRQQTSQNSSASMT